MRNLTVKQLTADRLQQAYPLLQSRDPGLSLEDWLSYAQSLMAPPCAGNHPAESGVLSVENEQGYIAALFTYRCHRDLKHGRLLMAENFVALDFLDPAACARALGEALEHLAGQLGCSAVHSIVAPAGEGHDGSARLMEDVLGSRGHLDRGRLFCKELQTQGRARRLPS
jgi:hypothetical protein